MQGYIKIHRKIKDWQHYHNPTVKHVFIDLLLDASHKPMWCRGIKLNTGEVVTSLNLLEQSTRLSRHTLITVLRLLEQSGEIRRRGCKNCTIITIINYSQYQDNNVQGGATIAPLYNDAQEIERQETIVQSSAETAPLNSEVVQNLHRGGAEGGATIAPHNKNTRIYNNNDESNNVRVRAHERVDVLRLQVLDSWSVEQACYTNCITEEQYKQLTEEIFSDWLFALDESKPVQPQLDEINKKHFLAVLRIKAAILNRQIKQNDENNRTDNTSRRRGSDTAATRTEDYATDF